MDIVGCEPSISNENSGSILTSERFNVFITITLLCFLDDKIDNLGGCTKNIFHEKFLFFSFVYPLIETAVSFVQEW